MTGQTPAEALGKSFKDRAGTAAAVVAVAGAVWYGAVSLLSAWVYKPVGVSPRDLGLTSSAILVQATIGLVVSVVIGVVVGTVVGGILAARHAAHDPELLPSASDDPVYTQLRLGTISGAAAVGAVAGSFVAVMLCLFAVIAVASDSRDAIQAGQASGFVLGLPAPWSATVADVHAAGDAPAQSAPDALPSCALFLGQHDSTVFLRDSSTRTIRVPASTVRLDLHDDRCPRKGGP